VRCSALQCVTVCCSVLQCVAVCCRVLQYVAVCCSVLQCVAVCCSVLQCVAVCCSVQHSANDLKTQKMCQFVRTTRAIRHAIFTPFSTSTAPASPPRGRVRAHAARRRASTTVSVGGRWGSAVGPASVCVYVRVCVCVRVCERERERKKESKRARVDTTQTHT